MARLRFGRPISLRWNGLLLEGPANTVFEIPDEYYEEFDEDIGSVEPTLEWLDPDEGATMRSRLDDLEAGGGGGGAALSSDEALALGTASAGTGLEASRDDHVHPTTGLALSGHNHDASYAATGHNHSGTYEPVNTAILKSVVDAKGDLIVGTAADTVDRLPGSGTNGYVLTYDSAETTGLKWAAAPGAGGGTSVGNATPLALGTASAGDDSTASREDHVHPTTGLALSGHNHDGAYTPIGDSNRADIVFETCKNSSGGAIAKGKVVYIDGADGTNPTIALADADTEATSSKTLGFTETASNNGDQVNVVTQGRLTNIDTSAAGAAGDSVWLSGTSGDVVYGAPPAEPAHSVYLGVVTKKNSSTGEIFVKVQNGYELDELHDVSAASPTAGDILQWATNGTNYMWRKKSLTDAGAALSGHNHDASYATTGHTHSYASVGSSSPLSVSSGNSGGTSSEAARVDHVHAGATTGHTHSGMVTTSDTGTVTSTMILDGTIVNGDINVSAGIAHSKLASVTAGSVLMGNVSEVATATALSGDVTVDSSGVTAIGSGVIVNADINASAAIADTKLATISTAGKVANSATTAVSTNTASAIVARDASGDFAANNITLNGQGDLRLADSDSSNWVALQAPATVASNVTWTLPSADGTSGQFLSTNGTGTLSWASQSSSGGMTLLASLNNASTDLTISSIPTTYKDLYIRVHGLQTTTNVTVSNITPSTGNMTGIYLATTSIDNDATYTSTTIVGTIGNSTTTTATKSFPSNNLIEVDSATYGGVLEIWFYDYANASGQNNGTRYFKTMSISPNGATAPTNASLIVGNGRFTLATATATVTSLVLTNLGASPIWAYVYGVS